MANWEIAEFEVQPGTEKEFEEGVRASLPVFAAADGLLSFELHKAVDKPNTFLLLIEWETVAHHTEKFANSEGIKEFVAKVSPYFAGAPSVYHTERVIDSL